MHGLHTPTKLVNGVQFPKHENEWNNKEKKLAQLNANTINILYCGLDENKFNKICTCSPKKIWDKLEIIHEGTNKVRIKN